MVNRDTNLLNAFQTTLSAEMTAVASSCTLTSATGLVQTFYMVIEPDDNAQREYMFVSVLAGTVCTVPERYLAGSAAPSGLIHPVGSVVRHIAMAQHIEDLNDRADDLQAQITALGDHGGLTGLTDDDHTPYILATGARAFTGTIAGVSPTGGADLATKAYIDARLPTGAILPYAVAAAPTGYLLCDGAAVSESTFAVLFALIGYTYGNPGGGNFNTPDMQQRFPLGLAVSGTGAAMGDTGGEVDHSHSMVDAHTHTMPSHAHGHGSHTHTTSNTGSTDPGDTNARDPGDTNTAGSHNHGRTGDAVFGGAGFQLNQHSGNQDPHDHTIPTQSAHSHTMPTHTHTMPSHTHTNPSTGSTDPGNSDATDPGDTNPAGDLLNTDTTNPPFLTLQYIIKT